MASCPCGKVSQPLRKTQPGGLSLFRAVGSHTQGNICAAANPTHLHPCRLVFGGNTALPCAPSPSGLEGTHEQDG